MRNHKNKVDARLKGKKIKMAMKKFPGVNLEFKNFVGKWETISC